MVCCWPFGSKELETLDKLHNSPVNVNGGLFGPPFSAGKDHLLCLAHIEGGVVVLAPHCQVSYLPIGCLVVGDQAYHCCVVSKLNDGVGIMLGHAVVGEQGEQEGTKHAPLRGPVLRISVADELLPTLTTWGWPVTMVLNAAL